MSILSFHVLLWTLVYFADQGDFFDFLCLMDGVDKTTERKHCPTRFTRKTTAVLVNLS